ncbi:IS3 family transposase [Nonomuraea dietziae]|uniref:IS3 family transposase n=1 Tax=Nonomuraea dietziae TaxID=65515 RepID=UPI0031DE8DED
MSVDPFIEAEKQSGHNVKRACELLGVSRTAFYARRSGVPGLRAVRDAELAARITEVPARSRGSYGAPRVHAQLQRDGQRCGRRRVARLMRVLGLAGRYQGRRQQTTIPDPSAGARPDLIVRDFAPDAGRARYTLVRRHYVHRHWGGLAISGHRHRYRLSPGRRLGDRRSLAHRPGR